MAAGLLGVGDGPRLCAEPVHVMSDGLLTVDLCDFFTLPAVTGSITSQSRRAKPATYLTDSLLAVAAPGNDSEVAGPPALTACLF